MEKLKSAIGKARERREAGGDGPERPVSAPPPRRLEESAPPGRSQLRARRAQSAESAWAALPELEVRSGLLRRRRVVTLDKLDVAYMSFDMLRTQILQTMKARGWRTLALTSPSQGCGKTLSTLNLAFSFARQPNCRTLVIDLDLRRPRIAKMLDARRPACISEVLAGRATGDEVLQRVGDTLAFGMAAGPVSNSSELLQDDSSIVALNSMIARFEPDVVVYDLPPMLASDDAVGFLGRVDGALLVAAAGETELTDIDACARQLDSLTHNFGVVLNKSEFMPKRYYEYSYA